MDIFLSLMVELSSVVPVWPRLPIHFLARDAFFAIASTVGMPLRLDAATQLLKRPSMARLQVEIDLLKAKPDKIWIGCDGGDGFWQKIEYDDVPDYCQHCWHVGHSESMCHVHNPELRLEGNRILNRKKMEPRKLKRQVYVPKNRNICSVGVQPSSPDVENDPLEDHASPADANVGVREKSAVGNVTDEQMQPPEVDTDVGKTVLSDAASSGLEPTQGPHNENNLSLIAQPSAPEHVPPTDGLIAQEVGF